MSSEDIRAEYPQVEHVASSSSKWTFYFATSVIKAHGTITTDEKQVLIEQRPIRAHPQTHLHIPFYSLILMAAPGKHMGNCTETRSFSSCQQHHFVCFNTGGTEMSHSLTGGMLSSASFSSPGSRMLPKSCWWEDSLPKHCPGHTALVPHSQVYFTM